MELASMYDDMDKRKKEYDNINLFNSNNMTPEFEEAKKGYIQNIQNESDIGSNLAQAQNVSNALGLFSQPDPLAQRLGVKPQERPDFTSPLKTLYDVQKQKTDRYRQMMDLLNKVKKPDITQKTFIVTPQNLHDELISMGTSAKKLGNPRGDFLINNAKMALTMSPEQATTWRNEYKQVLNDINGELLRAQSMITGENRFDINKKENVADRVTSVLNKYGERERQVAGAYDQLLEAKKALANGQKPNAFLEGVRAQVMKAMGDVGAVSDSDIRRMSGDRTFLESIKRYAGMKFDSGTNFTEKDINDLFNFVTTIRKSLEERKMVDVYKTAKRYERTSGVKAEDVLKDEFPNANEETIAKINDWKLTDKNFMDLINESAIADNNKPNRGLASEPQQKLNELQLMESILNKVKGTNADVNTPKLK